MTRHQRNATAGCVYTYHERKKDAATSGYGTNHARLGTDSVKGFDCCSLSLQPCKNPVITPDGWLYDKEAILEYILHKKQEIEKQMKEFERQSKQEKDEEVKTGENKQSQKLTAFMKNETSISSKPLNPFHDVHPPKSKEQMNQRKCRAPAMAPSQTCKREEPKNCHHSGYHLTHLRQRHLWLRNLYDKTVYCPMSDKPLKMKHMLPVEFTLADKEDNGKNLAGKQVRYKCAVTHDILTNSIRCAVIKTSGKVVTMDCVEKLIRKDMKDPFTGESLKESDIIPIKGGTGFASSGADLKAKKARPVMMAS
ncbi:putative nitric oxide synthase-interacting protein-like isoform X5 [Apostichopus japonicus]|uniref:Putative nitric oxide synthase-interacting protein-like isoform X5 n=1 Tax=Stichopus japonicus TaxID=307972 RepID=A0A2G8K720_STIJA|nr:putative nitric oxide synthase-interacting protein-like isoform X5 [Apostichopus japonicus]